jgi:hypothetical protein
MRRLLLARSHQLLALLEFLWRRLPSLSFGALVMYSLALAAELPVIITRLLLGVLVTTVVIALEGTRTRPRTGRSSRCSPPGGRCSRY